ncbi:MAG: EamA family transporter [Phascolarctobacterium sp.]|nr:EamA family transporter [Phascolarctobacterium sp.]
MSNSKSTSYACIILAAALWGLIGFFVKNLSAQGFSPLQITCLRTIAASICITPLVAMQGMDKFKIAIKDTWMFIGTGIISLTFFNWCYFNCMQRASLAVAALLLYTAPAFVMIMSLFLFGEKFTKQKGIALVMTFIGCACVTGVLSGELNLSLAGLLFGLGSGIGYALYSVFGKYAIRKYEPITISAYTFYFSFVATLFLADINGEVLARINWLTIAYVLGLGIICCLAPYILYTKGLAQVEAGKASVLATVEPLVAALVGVIFFAEPLTMEKIIGMALIFGAIGVLELKK